jgi:hypothetical protein
MKIWVFLIAVLIGCGGKPSVPSVEIRQLVFQLQQSDCVIIGGVGITGRVNPAADSYTTLLRIVPDSVWVRLSYNEKAVVRMYAYEALFSKSSPELEQVKIRLKRDTAMVCQIFDDVTITASIGEFVSLGRR